mmetsp:Transcript_17754/g.39099  ORF Transcript_17754/g.39099 Transcript_17754/m.39099 type:complete len:172 (+) Transcript_17754:1194-1709(+)
MQAEDDFKEEPELLFTSGRRLSEFHAANFAVAWNAFYQDVIFRCASPDEQRAVCELLVESLFRLYGYHHPQSLEFIHTLAELSEDQEEQAQILALEHVIFVTFFQEESEQLDQESYRLMYSLRPGEELPEEVACAKPWLNVPAAGSVQAGYRDHVQSSGEESAGSVRRSRD